MANSGVLCASWGAAAALASACADTGDASIRAAASGSQARRPAIAFVTMELPSPVSLLLARKRPRPNLAREGLRRRRDPRGEVVVALHEARHALEHPQHVV